MTNLESQIQLITVPQEFTRLCNAVLSAEYGNDYLPIDDDQPDRGNDGYLKSGKRLFAAHCFKRPQNQSINSLIRSKMIGDLGKAIALKNEGVWEIAAWTFLSNYPVNEAIAAQLVQLGGKAGIDVSWQGPAFLAEALQRHASIREQFPSLQVNEITDHLLEIKESLSSAGSASSAASVEAPDRVPRTPHEQRALMDTRPPGWEFLLFASVLLQGRESLEMKWHDHEMPPYRQKHIRLDDQEAVTYLNREFAALREMVASLMRTLPREVQEKAFGPSGVDGDPVRIEHFARRIIQTYEDILDWAAGFTQVEPPEILRDAFDVVPHLADRPLGQFRHFVDAVVSEMDGLPVRLAEADPDEDPPPIVLPLRLTIDEQVMDEFDRRMKRARRKARWGF